MQESGAEFLLQGTILTDVDETVAGIKRQYNILAQLGIDPEREFWYKVIAPLLQLRKDGVREVGRRGVCPNRCITDHPFQAPLLQRE